MRGPLYIDTNFVFLSFACFLASNTKIFLSIWFVTRSLVANFSVNFKFKITIQQHSYNLEFLRLTQNYNSKFAYRNKRKNVNANKRKNVNANKRENVNANIREAAYDTKENQ